MNKEIEIERQPSKIVLLGCRLIDVIFLKACKGDLILAEVSSYNKLD